MSKVFIFGLGYTGLRLAQKLTKLGWAVEGTGRQGTVSFEDNDRVLAALSQATHILSSVPPASGTDPVLDRYGSTLAQMSHPWIGYLSSTGVYGDTRGAWVDENAPIGGGRRTDRVAADAAWRQLNPCVRIFRLPGIYGPGRSALDRVRAQRAYRLDLPDQVFSRIHVDDIVSAIVASFDAPPDIYNIADDIPSNQNAIIEHACDLLGETWPPLISLDDAGLSPMARAFYAENRRIATGRAKRLLNWRPHYPSWREGLAACLSEEGRA